VAIPTLKQVTGANQFVGRTDALQFGFQVLAGDRESVRAVLLVEEDRSHGPILLNHLVSLQWVVTAKVTLIGTWQNGAKLLVESALSAGGQT
jgi:hypothetical protein